MASLSGSSSILTSVKAAMGRTIGCSARIDTVPRQPAKDSEQVWITVCFTSTRKAIGSEWK